MKATLLDITLIALGLAFLIISNGSLANYAVGYLWILAPFLHKVFKKKQTK